MSTSHIKRWQHWAAQSETRCEYIVQAVSRNRTKDRTTKSKSSREVEARSRRWRTKSNHEVGCPSTNSVFALVEFTPCPPPSPSKTRTIWRHPRATRVPVTTLRQSSAPNWQPLREVKTRLYTHARVPGARGEFPNQGPEYVTVGSKTQVATMHMTSGKTSWRSYRDGAAIVLVTCWNSTSAQRDTQIVAVIVCILVVSCGPPLKWHKKQ